MTESLGQIRDLVIDIDGVLWHGSEAFPGVRGLFEFLRRHSIRFVIATNNSARPGSEIVARLATLGVSVSTDEILTSAYATALYLPRLVPRGARVLVVGGEGITEALTRAGYQLVDENPAVVVAGIDFNLTYDKLKRAALAIRHGARFVGTNNDRTLPDSAGLIPGAGSIIAALQIATDVEPIIIGKPQRAMFDLAVEKLGGTPDTTAMLGDRLDTDIQGAERAGLRTILVLTGVTTPDVLARSTIHPHWVFTDLDALRTAWEENSPGMEPRPGE